MKIGWIGTGIMGFSMCRHLIEAGNEAIVFNRTISKAHPLVEHGAKLASSPFEVAQNCDVLFTMVGYPKDVEEVYFGENGIFRGIEKAKEEGCPCAGILVDMTTTKPSIAVRIHDKALELGIDSLDAPVSGGDSGARNATLSIMVGGNSATLENAMPLLAVMGKSIILEGPAGAGQHTKMANQIQIAGTMVGMCEALAYAKDAGLDLGLMVATISKGAAGCHSLDNLAPRIIKGDYAPGFIVEHFVKDMKIALEESRRMGLDLKGLGLVESMYEELCTMGFSKSGTQALVKVTGEGF